MSRKMREKLETARSYLTGCRAGKIGTSLAGRSMAITAGCCSMVLGTVLTFTICGAVVGIPLFAFGFLLVARGFF
jgi:hypothetical protein